MIFRLSTLLSSALAILPTVFSGPAYTIPYDNDFIDPSYILSKNYSKSTGGAQQTIIEWADYLNLQGPWSVMNKTVTPPTGSKHDYMSWAPYFWPNCSGVGNTTVMAPEEIWLRCNYYYRDGMFNPDRLLVNDTGNFDAMADAVFYNAIAWVLTGSSTYSAKAAGYVNTWFIDPESYMTPNLEYAQMERGPTGQIGTHTGLLDLKCMAKVTTGILVLRQGSSPHWTSDLDAKMVNWTTTYVHWMQTSQIAYGEFTALNNHGTFFYNQLAANQILIGDKAAAQATINGYFSKQYLAQIDGNGEQPFEMVRTHPYHYRAYNLAAAIINAKIGEYLGLSFWNTPTSKGGNIQKACDFAMQYTPDEAEGDGPASELYDSIATVASKYGDPGGKYASFIAKAYTDYPAEPWFFWDQPFSDSGLAAATPTSGGPSPTSTAVTTGKNGASRLFGRNSIAGYLLAIAWIVTLPWF